MDTKINQLLQDEIKRQEETLTLIPSENYASKSVRELVGSVLMNKYSEGYSGRRYYQGNTIIDKLEEIAVERAKELFGVPHVNVQPYSGSPANTAVLFALCEPQDTIIGLELSSGGHLTHGHPKITFSGKYFNSVQFGIEERYKQSLTSYKKIGKDIDKDKGERGNDTDNTSLIDYGELETLVKINNPKVMIIGTTAYPQILDWQKLGEIADKADCYLVADISHVSGLIVGGQYPSPVNFAHVVTTTTHKTLRGPRGAMVMVTDKGIDKDKEIVNKIDRAIFPGLQGGPHNNTTAAIAQCLFEASQKEFKEYSKQVVLNAKILADELITGGLKLVGSGTECHLLLIDLSPINLSGNVVAEALEVAGIITNRNSIPGNKSPFYPSGLRLGTPAVTTRGMAEKEMKQIAKWILKIINHVKDEKLPQEPKEKAPFIKELKKRLEKDKLLLGIKSQVAALCEAFPTP